MKALSGVLLAAGLCAAAVVGFTYSSKGGVLALSRGSCFVRLWHDLPGDTEIVFTGSSRIQRGVQVDMISEALGLGPTGAVNLAHPNAALPLDYALLERLTEDHAPRVVVVGVQPRSQALHDLELSIDPSAPDVRPPLSFGTVNPRYLLGADMGHITRLVFEQTDNDLLALWQAARMWSARLSYTVPQMTQAFKNLLKEQLNARDPAHPRFSLNYEPGRRQDCREADWFDPSEDRQHGSPQALALKEGYRAAFAGWQDPDPLGFFEVDSAPLDHAMIEQVVALSQARGWDLYFLYLPALSVPADGPALSARFAETFGAPLLVPPPELRAQFADGGYFDHSHLNMTGGAQLSAWLAERLSTPDEGRP